MRASAKKQIQSLGIVLPFDAGISVPFTLSPILFKDDKFGDFLRTELQKNLEPRFSDQSLQTSNLTFPDEVIKGIREFNDCSFDLVFIRRNYDGTEIYYLVHTLHPSEYSKFAAFIGKTKGGMVL